MVADGGAPLTPAGRGTSACSRGSAAPGDDPGQRLGLGNRTPGLLPASYLVVGVDVQQRHQRQESPLWPRGGGAHYDTGESLKFTSCTNRSSAANGETTGSIHVTRDRK